MGCACCKAEPQAKKVFKDLNDRSCTDMLCIGLFIVSWAGMIVIAILSFQTGNPDALFYPSDYKGQFCGKAGTAVADRPWAFYPQLEVDVKNQMGYLAVGAWWKFVPYTLCVSKCPSEFTLKDPNKYGGATYPGANATDKEFYSAFKTVRLINRCFPTNDIEASGTRFLCAKPACNSSAAVAVGATCTFVESQPTVTTAWEANTTAKKAACELVVREQETTFFTPGAQDPQTTTYVRTFATYVGYVLSYLKAIEKAILQILVCGVAGPCVLGFVWTFALSLLAGFFVWLCLFLLLAFQAALSVLFLVKSGWAQQALMTTGFDLTSTLNATLTNMNAGQHLTTLTTSSYATVYGVFGIIFGILFLLTLIWIIATHKCVARTIAILRQLRVVFMHSPLLMFWPFFAMVIILLPIIYLGVVAAWIFTTKPESYANAITAYNGVYSNLGSASAVITNPTLSMALRFLVNLLGVLWTMEFIKACSWCTIAGAVTYVYFFKGSCKDDGTINDDEKIHKERFPILGGAWRVFRYHLGSALFGSLIIAICQFIRWVLAGLNYYTKDLQDKNILLKLVLKCAMCAVYCLEKTIEFVSYYAFIYVALKGHGFCRSCGDTFKLILANPSQTALNKTVSAILRLLVTWTTPTLLAFITFEWLDRPPYTPDLNPVYPAVNVWVIAFFLSDAIGTAFACTVDTLYICAFTDVAEYEGRYMLPGLRDSFGIGKDVSGEAAPMATAASIKAHREELKNKEDVKLNAVELAAQ